jgi:hypothetical protein
MESFKRFAFIFLVNLAIAAAAEELKYQVEVQVVDLQVSVSDRSGNFIMDLHPDDFLVWEDKVPQEVLDLIPVPAWSEFGAPQHVVRKTSSPPCCRKMSFLS